MCGFYFVSAWQLHLCLWKCTKGNAVRHQHKYQSGVYFGCCCRACNNAISRKHVMRVCRRTCGWSNGPWILNCSWVDYHFIAIKHVHTFHGFIRISFPLLCPRLAILRVHSHRMVTIDLQCFEDDDVAQLDNVGDSFNAKHDCTVQTVMYCCSRWGLA